MSCCKRFVGCFMQSCLKADNKQENNERGFNKDYVTAHRFLDVSKAFDRVWHIGIVFRINWFRFPMISSFLEDSHIRNKIQSI